MKKSALCLFISILLCLLPAGRIHAKTDPYLLAMELTYPPGAFIISEENYNVFFRGLEENSVTSLSRINLGIDDVKSVMASFPDADVIASPVGETWETGMTIGFVNVHPDYFLLAEKPFGELIEGNDPLFLGQILNGMQVSSLDEVEIYENEETTFLYQERQNADGSAFSEYITMFDTTLFEIYVETHLSDTDPNRNMETVRELAKTLADSLHTTEYLQQLIQKIKEEK